MGVLFYSFLIFRKLNRKPNRGKKLLRVFACNHLSQCLCVLCGSLDRAGAWGGVWIAHLESIAARKSSEPGRGQRSGQRTHTTFVSAQWNSAVTGTQKNTPSPTWVTNHLLGTNWCPQPKNVSSDEIIHQIGCFSVSCLTSQSHLFGFGFLLMIRQKTHSWLTPLSCKQGMKKYKH